MTKESDFIEQFMEISKQLIVAEDHLLQVWFCAEEHDAEVLHDLRVNLRKLLSLLEFSKPLLKKAVYVMLKERFRQLLRSLGPTRSADVFMRNLDKYLEERHDAVDPDILFQLRGEILSLNKAKKKIIESDAEFRRIFYSCADLYWQGGTKMIKRNHLNKGASLDQYTESRFSELYTKYGMLKKDSSGGNVKKIHELRVLGKTIYYNLKSYEDHLTREVLQYMDLLLELHDVTGKIHDYEEHIHFIELLKKQQDDFTFLVGAEQYFMKEKEKQLRRFWEITKK